MLALSLPTLSLQNDFASKTRSRNRSRKLIAPNTAASGFASPTHGLRFLNSSRVFDSSPSLESPAPGTYSPRKSFILRTYEKGSCNSSAINTYRTKDLKFHRMNTYRKTGGWGVEREAPGKGRSRGKKVRVEREIPGKGSPRGKKVAMRASGDCPPARGHLQEPQGAAAGVQGADRP